MRFHRIGYLGAGSLASSAPNIEPFRERLGELGYAEGRNIAIDLRYADGRADRLPDLAAELVGLNVDAILTDGNTGVQAARRSTASIPIVFAIANDPVAEGFVASLARPGGNITGLLTQTGQEEANGCSCSRRSRQECPT